MVEDLTMGYSNRFVLCILINGVPVKELANGEVHIPFGSNYEIRLRNRHNRNAAVQIYIDGENVSGEGYKIPANDKIDIKRYADKDVTFKFVDLDSPDAVEFGKNGPNPDKIKGLIEGRFFLEKEKPVYKYVKNRDKVEHHHHHHPYPVPKPYPVWPIGIAPYQYSGSEIHCDDGSIDADAYVNSMDSRRSTSKGYSDIAKGGTVHDQRSMSFSSIEACSASHYTAPPLREGATVEGHISGQRFNQVYMDLETDFVSVKVFLKGYDPENTPVQSIQSPLPEGQPINESGVSNPPIYSKQVFCEGCGVIRENLSANFCGNCGHKHFAGREVIVNGNVVGHRG